MSVGRDITQPRELLYIRSPSAWLPLPYSDVGVERALLQRPKEHGHGACCRIGVLSIRPGTAEKF